MDLISALLGLSQHFCSDLCSPVMIKTLPACKSLHVVGVKVGQVTVNPLPINLRHILHTGRSWHSHNTHRANGVPMMPGGHKSQRKEVATEWQKVATACCLQLFGIRVLCGCPHLCLWSWGRMGGLHDRCYKADSWRFGDLNREHICNVVCGCLWTALVYIYISFFCLCLSRMAATGLHAALVHANRYQSHLLQRRHKWGTQHKKNPPKMIIINMPENKSRYKRN